MMQSTTENPEPRPLPAVDVPPAERPDPPTLPAPDTLSSVGPDLPVVPGYELLGELGRGGMGVVYKARQIGLDRVVALKMILAGRQASAESRVRFHIEARAAASLQHPNIVQIYEIGEADECPFFSLEYVDGASLAQKYAGAPQPPRLAAGLVHTLARAIEQAHEHGIIHRDLKPANVLLTQDGTPKITDFGLAKRLEGDNRQTRPGAVLGTPEYMAPEQAAGRNDEIGPACDVYSLGVLLYELLTGRPPFLAGSAVETLLQVVHHDPTPPSRLVPETPRDLETITLECLHKAPTRRYASAAALAADLERFLADQPIHARPVRTLERFGRWCRRNPAVAGLIASVALLLLLFLIGAVATAVVLDHQRRAAVNSQQRAVEAEQEARERLWESLLAQARMGRFSGLPGRRFEGLEAVQRAAEMRPALELRNEAIACLALADLRNLTTIPAELAGHALHGCRISESERAVFIRQAEEEVARVEVPGRLVETQISDDGLYLAIRHQTQGVQQLLVWGWQTRQVLFRVAQVQALSVSFAANGRSMLYLDGTGTWCRRSLPQGAERKMRIPLPAPVRGFALAPDGNQVAVSPTVGGLLRILDLERLRVTGLIPLPPGMVRLAWSPDGRFLATGGGDRRTYLVDVPAQRLHGSVPVQSHDGLRFSPSGELLVGCGWGGRVDLIHVPTASLLLGLNGGFRGALIGRERPGTALVEPSLWITGATRAAGSVVEVAPARECRLLADAGRDFSAAADFSPDGRLLAIADEQGVRLHDLASAREVARLPLGLTAGVAFDRTGALWTYSGRSGLLRWPVRSAAEGRERIIGPPTRRAPAPTSASWYNWLASGHDGRVAVTDWARNLILWLPAEEGQGRTLSVHGARMVSPSPCGRYLAVGVWKAGHVVVWDEKVHRPVLTVATGKEEAGHALFSPCGRWLVVSLEGEYRQYTVGTWNLVRTYPRREPWLPGPLAFSPDGSLLALCESRSQVRLVNSATGTEVATLQAPLSRDIAWLRFSPDGGHLVAPALSGTWLWDMRLLRHQLARMKLNWEGEIPAAPAWLDAEPLTARLVIDRAGVNPFQPSPVLELPAPAAATPEQVGRWVEELRTGNPQAREMAAQSLAAAGEPARQALAALKPGEEAFRQRVRLLLDRLEVAAALTPRRVRLKLVDATPAEAIAALTRQAPLPFELDGVPTGDRDRRVSIEVVDEPFWQALDRICGAAGWSWQPDSLGRGLRLGPGAMPAPGLVAYSGPCQLQVVGLSWQRSIGLSGREPSRTEVLNLGMRIALEPGAAVLTVGTPTLKSGTDDTGRSLEKAPGPAHHMPVNRNSVATAYLALSLRPPAAGARKLVRVEGTLPIEVMAQRERLMQVRDPLGAAKRVVKGEAAGVTLEVVRIVRGAGSAQIHVRVHGLKDFHRDAHQWQAVDGRGRPLRLVEQLASRGPDGFVATLTMDPAGLDPQTMLTLDRYHRVWASVPFTFRDVPLP